MEKDDTYKVNNLVFVLDSFISDLPPSYCLDSERGFRRTCCGDCSTERVKEWAL